MMPVMIPASEALEILTDPEGKNPDISRPFFEGTVIEALNIQDPNCRLRGSGREKWYFHGSNLYLSGLVFKGGLRLPGSMFGGRLYLYNTTIEGDLDLSHCTAEGLEIHGLKVMGAINMKEIRVGYIACDRRQADIIHHAAPTIPLVYAGGLWEGTANDDDVYAP